MAACVSWRRAVRLTCAGWLTQDGPFGWNRFAALRRPTGRSGQRDLTRVAPGTLPPGPGVDDEGRLLLLGPTRKTAWTTDEHVHLEQWAAARRRLDLSGASSPRHATALMATPVAGRLVEPDVVVMGHGFWHTMWSEPLEAALLGRGVAGPGGGPGQRRPAHRVMQREVIPAERGRGEAGPARCLNRSAQRPRRAAHA